MKPYETPRIQTMTASEIIETLGPVQGYGGGDPFLAGGKGPTGSYATGGAVTDIAREY